MNCPKCNNVQDTGNFCTVCGTALTGENFNQQYYTPNAVDGQPYYAGYKGYYQKSKLVAGLLGIFLGGLGIHNFYLGYTGKGILQILVTFLTCGIGSLWGFIEGIIILCSENYVDAKGVPLKMV